MQLDIVNKRTEDRSVELRDEVFGGRVTPT